MNTYISTRKDSYNEFNPAKVFEKISTIFMGNMKQNFT